MTSGAALAALEWLWLLLVVVGLAVHGHGLWLAYADGRLLRQSGANGRRAIVAAMHVRNHWIRLAVKMVMLVVALVAVATPQPPPDHPNATPILMTGAALAVSLLLLAGSLADARDRQTLIDWYKGDRHGD